MTETHTVVADGESEAQTNVNSAYDEEKVRKCQRIVRLWIARKRTSRFASVGMTPNTRLSENGISTSLLQYGHTVHHPMLKRRGDDLQP